MLGNSVLLEQPRSLTRRPAPTVTRICGTSGSLPTCVHIVWKTTTNIFHGRPRMLTRDLFAVANYSVVYYVHRLCVCFCVFATCCCETSLYIRYTCHVALWCQTRVSAISRLSRRLQLCLLQCGVGLGRRRGSPFCRRSLPRRLSVSLRSGLDAMGYIIAAWWQEWRTWTIIKLPHNNFLPLLAGNPTLEIPTSATTDRNWSLIYILSLSPDKW